MAKQRPITDPFKEREAQKYQYPIPSRECILQQLTERGAPISFEEIANLLGIQGEAELEGLRRRLRAMERDGQIVLNRQKCYGPARKMDLVSGRVIGHADGFGFLVPDEGEEDLFLSPKQMRGVLHGDRVLACVIGVDRRGRREGAIVEVLERAQQRLVGRFHLEHGVSFVTPSNSRISQNIAVSVDHRNGALDGQIVDLEILEQPTVHSQPVGKIVSILGDHMAPGMEIDIAVRTYDLPYEWPETVSREIAMLTADVPEIAKQGREDLRMLPLVTIDGEDARDFDDAVYCERKGAGWRLLVAIADVSFYVQVGTALDQEARVRGNSVYFPGRVIPMLPEMLSNGLCSLNPNVDRLCIVCELNISTNGQVRNYRFFEGVMRSAARLTYTEVSKAIAEHNVEAHFHVGEILPQLENLHALYQALRKQREQRGAIDFETTETKIQFDDGGKIAKIVPMERNDAHRLIEECMVVANVAAAEFLLENGLPALYRVHTGPSTEKLEDLRVFLAGLGLSLGGGEKPQSKHYAKLLQSVRSRPDNRLIQTVLLRSLAQAMYSPDNIGHFGLAYDAYTHFTSPIRRYPDLLVHRAIRYILASRDKHQFTYAHGDMQNIGDHCSLTERRADEATRDAIDWLKCEYMQDKVGEVFDGLITAVTGFGIFVELKDIYVEGLVHVTALGQEYFHFDPIRHCLLGERTRTMFRLADSIAVKVVRVNLDERKLDFELAKPVLLPRKGLSKSKGRR